MPIKDKNFYNEASALKLGWTPQWFNCENFDGELVNSIKKFQKDHELTEDGLCGEGTFRVIYTEREAKIEQLKQQCKNNTKDEKIKKFIVCDDIPIEIEWDKVVGMFDSKSLRLTEGFKYQNAPRKITQFVCHHDAALSAKSCHDILKRRGLSVAFLIDNDGTIYQCVDPKHISWHAKGFNDISVGVEISNAVEIKYQKYYVSKGFEERPIIPKKKIHRGTIGPTLGFYDIQVKALIQLLKSVCGFYKIPIQIPLDDDGNVINKVIENPKEFQGIIAHYHNNKDKIDPIGLDFKKVLNELKND